MAKKSNRNVFIPLRLLKSFSTIMIVFIVAPVIDFYKHLAWAHQLQKEREKKFSNMRCPYKRRNEKKTWLCKENFATNVYGDTMFLM